MNLQVSAVLTMYAADGTPVSSTYTLRDNGLGTPDVAQNDGVYSGNMIEDFNCHF